MKKLFIAGILLITTLVILLNASGIQQAIQAYTTVQSAGVPLTQRSTINFLGNTACGDVGGITVCNTTSGGSVGSSRVQAHKAASQSINNGATTALQFDTNDYASGSAIHDVATNNTRFTAPATGLYYMMCQIQWGTGLIANTTRSIAIRLNGTDTKWTTLVGNNDGTDQLWIQTSAFAPMTSGDYFECMGLQRSGGAINAVGGIDATQGIMWALQ